MTPLSTRIEALTGPSREVDAEIWAAHHGYSLEWQGKCLVIDGHVVGAIDPGEFQRNFSCNRPSAGPGAIPAYTASIDCAATLVPEWWSWNLGENADGWEAVITSVGDGGFAHVPSAPTPALALASAAMKARDL
ncbi:hypothetical protein KFK14_12850 [Sphingobium phenoxybenzoativorans]|uniref:Uncharacterized protein n=1 Tax=Sphingobium phenoxybenzoativorans TaxID=1592790 RepID=A0A975K338_9SPHN|nr:hypothetical protein [Sphingobium phenoxybenzoativorans]QUT04035.1 hypothetical protein KFK14_12850 [Sphingobium phenoxybenzoativorans]